MRKLKKVKSNIAIKAHYKEADTMQMLYAGANMLVAFTIDYFEVQDTAFCEEYLITINWAFKFMDKFKEKLRPAQRKTFIFDIAAEKYTFILAKANMLTINSLGFNTEDEREKEDKKYYDFLNLTLVIFDSLINKITDKKDDWIKKYFKMLKIQIRSIMKIFEEEMKLI